MTFCAGVGAETAAQQRGERLSWRELARRGALASNRLLLRLPRITTVESEPNNTFQTAQAVTLRDTVEGAINPAGDVDFFVFDVPANSALALEVIAQRMGSPLNPVLELRAADGVSVIGSNDDAFGRDSRIRINIETAGRFYVTVGDQANRGGSAYTYRLVIGRLDPGPGDPSRLHSAGVGVAWAAAAAAGGVLYMADFINGRVLRISSTGQPSIIASNLGEPLDVAVDGFGNLIVAGNDARNEAYLKRITPAGQQSDFAPGGIDPVAITIGPDGDVWVADPLSGVVRRYDPLGAFKNVVPLTGVRGLLLDLAFSPAGDLHVSNYDDAIYRLIGDRFVPVITGNFLGSLAFDRDGNLYLATLDRGVLLYDPLYRPVHVPFAISQLGEIPNLVFGRDATGGMTSRLFVLEYLQGTIRELNSAGVRAPGFRIGVDFLIVANDTLRRGLMGASYADTLRVQDASAPLTWRVSGGALPSGLTLNSNGVISGVPETSGTFEFSVRADGGGRLGVKTFGLVISRPVVDAQAAARQLLGIPGSITLDLERFLDLQGNRNGFLDIGDLHLYLRGRSLARVPGRRS